jgi:UDP-N-acetyl-D-galactosamine dehydrogenase
MAAHIAKVAVQKLIKAERNVKNSRILILGATFKEDVSDIRNSKIVDIVQELESYEVNVEVVDPHADSEELQHEYGFGLRSEIGAAYDGIILAVPHADYRNLNEAWFQQRLSEGGFLLDLKGLYRDRFQNLDYWSL